AEGLHPRSRHRHHADGAALAQQWDPEHGSEAADLLRLGPRVFRIGEAIGQMHQLRLEARSPDQRASARCNRMFPYVGLVFPGEAVVRSEMVEPVLEEKDEGVLGLAEPSGGLDKRIEHRLELESRAADDLEDLRGRGLLLERFAQLLGADLDLLLE